MKKIMIYLLKDGPAEVWQWAILVNEPGGALPYYSFFKKFIPKVSSTMLMEHFLCDDACPQKPFCEGGYSRFKNPRRDNNYKLVIKNTIVYYNFKAFHF
jgi:hypothetical protein